MSSFHSLDWTLTPIIRQLTWARPGERGLETGQIAQVNVRVRIESSVLTACLENRILWTHETLTEQGKIGPIHVAVLVQIAGRGLRGH